MQDYPVRTKALVASWPLIFLRVQAAVESKPARNLTRLAIAIVTAAIVLSATALSYSSFEATVTRTATTTIVTTSTVTSTGTSTSSSSSSTSTTTTSTSSTFTVPAYVTIFGLVSTLGDGTHPTSIVFTSVHQESFVAPVVNGSFSIKVPNQDTYNVSLNWAGNYTWQTGQIDRGTTTVNMSAGSMDTMSYNVAQKTPDSMIKVEGSVIWQIQSSIPAVIRFTASDGEEFQAPVTNMTFFITLPNMMNYQVYVQSRNATGYTDWYYFHQLEVNAGIDVVGLTVRVGD